MLFILLVKYVARFCYHFFKRLQLNCTILAIQVLNLLKRISYEDVGLSLFPAIVRCYQTSSQQTLQKFGES